jgi:hypothetical protein
MRTHILHMTTAQNSPSAPAGESYRISSWRVDSPGPGRWRTKAAAQLPCEWLESESIMVLTSTPKLALEHGAYTLRCPSRPIATLMFSSSDGKVGFDSEKY